MRALIAAALILISLAVLEYARWGIQITASTLGTTPVTAYALPGATGPVVVMAHGFAGSQQMMQGYALPLAQAGYRVYVFEFLGHGRNPTPMSGDVTSPDGTTRLLVDQTAEVIAAVADPAQPTALIGHSMATDILVRGAKTTPNIGPLVLISAFSNEITATAPANLLLITGQWESGLIPFAQTALQMVNPAATTGQTIQNGPVTRRAILAPYSEHVSVLHSRAGRREAVAWLDQAYNRTSAVPIPPTGWAILALLAAVVLIFRRLSQTLPATATPTPQPSTRQTAAILILPALAAPLIAVPLNPHVLPVLVADYLGLHLFLYGTLQLALLTWWKLLPTRFNAKAFLLLLLWCAVFSLALNRYAANFWPTPGRLWIIAVLFLGAMPYMLADQALTAQSRPLRRFATRLAFLISLGVAVALDFSGLFFLILIAPILVLFYLVFGTMGRDLAQRSGALSAGLALGVVLAWALGVSFPLFQS